MPTLITVPRLGWSMDEGTLVEWLKEDGQRVDAGDMLFVIEGDKALQEIESFDAGILFIPPDAPRPGDPVAVGQALAFLLNDDEPVPDTPLKDVSGPARETAEALHVEQAPAGVRAQSESAAPVSSVQPVPVAGPAARRRARELGIDLNAVSVVDPTGRVRREDLERYRQQTHRGVIGGTRVIASPRARRKARQLGIDYASVAGSGRNGRVRERDVIAAAASARSHLVPSTAAEIRPQVPGTLMAASHVRATIAQRMLAAVHNTAPVTLTTKVDASAMVALRERIKSSGWKCVASYNDILMHAVAATLSQSPMLNACWFQGSVHVYDEINIALAVQTDSGLLAPVLRNVPSMTLEQVAMESARLIDQARSGELRQQQLEGGTFTITNLGVFDIDHFTPIINLPQTAILGVGRIAEEPVVRERQIVVGQTLPLSLTFDHRVIDGGPAASWLQQLSQVIEGFAHQVSGFDCWNDDKRSGGDR